MEGKSCNERTDATKWTSWQERKSKTNGAEDLSEKTGIKSISLVTLPFHFVFPSAPCIAPFLFNFCSVRCFPPGVSSSSFTSSFRFTAFISLHLAFRFNSYIRFVYVFLSFQVVHFVRLASWLALWDFATLLAFSWSMPSTPLTLPSGDSHALECYANFLLAIRTNCWCYSLGLSSISRAFQRTLVAMLLAYSRVFRHAFLLLRSS